MDNIFGEPTKCTRIGDEYQTQIPNVVMKETIKDEENKYIGSVEKHVQLPAVPIIDEDAFLLGLYIFGKNFKHVKKFIGNKGMSDVLFYYYGQFYGDNKRKIWSSSWMNKNKKKKPGMKIFEGWRLEELFGRIFPRVTDENKYQLTKATRNFNDKEISFETYVFSVLDIVGINMLVEAAAIGKENLDLTSRRCRLTKEKLHPPFSSLTTDAIINLLKYGIELSKENLAELFWEAVWPRLLARGWKSTQLRNYDFNNSEISLVFLAPGVTKFSSSRQTKGIHHFMSFADVLNKVASKPQLIELDQDQDMLDPEEKQSSHKEEVVQFLIVDSSLEYLENQIFKTGKMRSLRDSEVSDEEDSANENQNQKMIQNRCSDKYRIFTQDGESITKRNCPLAGKKLEVLTGGSDFLLKRKRGVQETISALETEINI